MTTTDRESPLDSPQPPAHPDPVGGGTGGNGSEPRRLSDRLSRLWADPGSRRVCIGWAALVASLVVYFFIAGIPWSQNWVFIYITAGLIVSSLGTGVRWKRLLADWLPLFLVLTGYGYLRSYASHTLWGPLVKPQVWFDTHVFGGLAPTVQLQRWLYSPGLHFWDYLCWCCYMTHFFASFIVAGVLWKTNYPNFKRYVPLFVALTFAGYVTYVLYPAMPPWLASQTGISPCDPHRPRGTRPPPLPHRGVDLHRREQIRQQRGGDAVTARRLSDVDLPLLLEKPRRAPASSLRRTRSSWPSPWCTPASTSSSTSCSAGSTPRRSSISARSSWTGGKCGSSRSAWRYPRRPETGGTAGGGSAGGGTGCGDQTSVTAMPFQKATLSVISLAASFGVG